MKIAILNYATDHDDLELLTQSNYEMHRRSEPVHNLVCAEGDLERNLENVKFNIACDLTPVDEEGRGDIPQLIWSDSETTEGVYEGRDSNLEIRAVITVWVVEV